LRANEIVWVLGLLLLGRPVLADSPPLLGGTAEVAAQEPERGAGPEKKMAIVRGLFVGAKLTGGYMVADRDVGNPTNPSISKSSEKMGLGGGITMAMGYDISESIAVQALAGALNVAGRRADRPRDLAFFHLGIGARVAFGLSERLDAIVEPGALYVWRDNGVKSPRGGFGASLNAGVEYYVHVRHFSVGIMLSAFAPVEPFRLYLGITPTLKYTF